MALALAETFVRLVGREGAAGAGLAGGALEEADLSVSFEAAAEDFGNGKRYIVTLGSVLSSFSFSSIGKSPLSFGCREPCNSCAMIVKSSRSARSTCPVETQANPLGGSLVICPRSCCTQISCSALLIREH